jgi:excisionase family DNA binding protein
MQQQDLTVKEAAALLKLSPATIRRLISGGLLTAIRVGQRKFLIPERSIEAYRQRQTMTAAAERLADPKGK